MLEVCALKQWVEPPLIPIPTTISSIQMYSDRYVAIDANLTVTSTRTTDPISRINGYAAGLGGKAFYYGGGAAAGTRSTTLNSITADMTTVNSQAVSGAYPRMQNTLATNRSNNVMHAYGDEGASTFSTMIDANGTNTRQKNSNSGHVTNDAVGIGWANYTWTHGGTITTTYQSRVLEFSSGGLVITNGTNLMDIARKRHSALEYIQDPWQDEQCILTSGIDDTTTVRQELNKYNNLRVQKDSTTILTTAAMGQSGSTADNTGILVGGSDAGGVVQNTATSIRYDGTVRDTVTMLAIDVRDDGSAATPL